MKEKNKYPGFRKVGRFFYFRISEGGKQHWKNGGETIQMAMEKRTLLNAAKIKGELPTLKKILFEELAQDYLTHVSNNNRNQKRPRASVKALLSFFKGMPISRIDFSLVERYKQARLQQGKSNNTINIEISCLATIFRLAIESKKANHVPHFKRLPTPEPRSDTFSHGKYLELLKVLPPYMVPFIQWAFLTGERKTEIETLKWDEVDWENRKIIIPAYKTKTKKIREIPCTDQMMLILTNQFALRNLKHPDCPWVFFQPNGSRIKDYYACWNTAMKKIGLPGHRVHGLRRTFVTNARESGMDQKIAMSISGHRSRKTFDDYYQPREEEKRKEMEKLEEYNRIKFEQVTSQKVVQLPVEELNKNN